MAASGRSADPGWSDALGDWIGQTRLELANLRQQARPGVLLPPLILLLAVFAVAYLLRPSDATAMARADYETFFEASAAVLGTILIAIVLQADLFRGPSLRRILIYGLLYIALAEAAALLALLPGGSEQFKGVLFALTVSAGIGALGAVVYIGIRLLETPTPELEFQSDGSARIEPAEEPGEPVPSPARREAGDAAAVGEDSRPAQPARQGRGERERERERERDRERERERSDRERTSERHPGAGRRPREKRFVLMHSDAVADLEELGPAERNLVLAITERSLSDDRIRRKRSVQVDDEWSELRAGGLRIVFRDLSTEEAAAQGQPRGTLVRRILTEALARQWLAQAARHAADPDDPRGWMRLQSGRRNRHSGPGDEAS